MDSSKGCYGELTDEEICSSVLQSDSAVQPQSDDEEDESASTPGPIPKSGEALQAIRTVRVFLELNRTDLSMFYHVESQVLKHYLSNFYKGLFSLHSPEYGLHMCSLSKQTHCIYMPFVCTPLCTPSASSTECGLSNVISGNTV